MDLVEVDDEQDLLQRLARNPYVPDDRGGVKRRVRTMTPARKRRFCAALAAGASPTKAACAVGVARSTAYYQRGIDQDFAEAWAEALERQADLAEDTLAELAHKTKNVGAAIFTLKNLRPEKWKDRHEVVSESHSTSLNLSAQLGPEATQALLDMARREQDRKARPLPWSDSPTWKPAPEFAHLFAEQEQRDELPQGQPDEEPSADGGERKRSNGA